MKGIEKRMNNKIKLAMMTTAPMAAMFLAETAHADEQYTVQSGDTLYKISQKFDVDMQTIADENHIDNINQIYVGDQLTIPTKGSQSTSSYTNQTVQTQTTKANTTTTNNTNTQTSTNQAATNTQKAVTVKAETSAPKATSSASSSEEAAKAWIANRESGGSYSATNGRYIGKYQLDASYLNGDYSAANQERVANNYVKQRYGSWSAAQSFWQANGWY